MPHASRARVPRAFVNACACARARVDARVGAALALVALVALAATPAAAQAPPGVKIPPQPFGQMPNPPPPDYAQPRYWAALPDRLDAADVVPENDPFGDRQASAPVDVFYIHPTTYRDGDFWNQPLDDAKTNDWTDESVVARQAAVFNACCRVFAPRYRQAASAGVYAPPAMKATDAYEFAWGDVRSAFLHYLKHWNKGRPFIIAGHSQGAAHTERWLNEFGKDPKLARRLVAAYPIGIAFAEGAVARLPGVKGVCRMPAADRLPRHLEHLRRRRGPGKFVKSAQARYAQKSGTTVGQEIVCVNPLTFDAARPVAPARMEPRRAAGAAGCRAGRGARRGHAAAGDRSRHDRRRLCRRRADARRDAEAGLRDRAAARRHAALQRLRPLLPEHPRQRGGAHRGVRRRAAAPLRAPPAAAIIRS